MTRPPPPAKFGEEAVRFALFSGMLPGEIATDLGVGYESLWKWIKQHRVGGLNALGSTSSERGTLLAHARQNPRLDTDVRILVLLS